LQEIRPAQLRALLLLLVLVPLIPTALMLRFMRDAWRSERDAALERTAALYQQALLTAGASFEKYAATRAGAITPQEAHNFYRGLLDRAVAVRVVDAAGRPLTASTLTAERPIAQSSLGEYGLPWSVHLHWLDRAALEAESREQARRYLWIGGGTLFVTLAFAILAGLAVSRQLRVQELKSTAVATVAHELRTPLASMRMLVDTLRDGRYRDEAQLREYLALIGAENERLSRLTENFLTHARLERAAPRLTLAPVDLAAALHDALRPFRPRLEAPGCRFTLELPAPPPQVRADRDALITIVANLLDNALKYTAGKKEIALRVRTDAACAILEVRDNGPGLTRAERRAIFAPFYQADRRLSRTGSGCGLGLSIVHRLVAALDGTIEVASEPGQGSAFTVTLPLAVH
jgi:signal transduction histidine kinase